MKFLTWMLSLTAWLLCMSLHADDLFGNLRPWKCPIDLPEASIYTEGIISVGLKSDIEASKPEKPSRNLSFYGSRGVVWTDERENTIHCESGTTLFLYGKSVPEPYRNPSLEVDHHSVATDNDCKTYDYYAFTWVASSPGVHTLAVIFKPKHHGAPVVVRTVMVKVSSDAPVSLGTLPASCGTDTKIVLSRASISGFTTKQSALVVHDLAYPFYPAAFAIADDLNAVTIPASQMMDGNYEFYTESYGTDGRRFLSRPQIITVNHSAGDTKR